MTFCCPKMIDKTSHILFTRGNNDDFSKCACSHEIRESWDNGVDSRTPGICNVYMQCANHFVKLHLATDQYFIRLAL